MKNIIIVSIIVVFIISCKNRIELAEFSSKLAPSTGEMSTVNKVLGSKIVVNSPTLEDTQKQISILNDRFSEQFSVKGEGGTFYVKQQTTELTMNIEASSNPDIEIVFSLDSSGSMGGEIAVLNSNIASFINLLKYLVPNSDINVIITHYKVASGRTGAIFYKNCVSFRPTDTTATYNANITAITSTSSPKGYLSSIDTTEGGESPLQVGKMAFEASPISPCQTLVNPYRFLFAITDENERPINDSNLLISDTKINELKTYFNTNGVTVYSVVPPTDNTYPPSPSVSPNGSVLRQFSTVDNTYTIDSVCQNCTPTLPGFVKFLERFANGIKNTIYNNKVTNGTIDSNSLQVYVNGTKLVNTSTQTEYSYDPVLKIVTFNGQATRGLTGAVPVKFVYLDNTTASFNDGNLFQTVKVDDVSVSKDCVDHSGLEHNFLRCLTGYPKSSSEYIFKVSYEYLPATINYTLLNQLDPNPNLTVLINNVQYSTFTTTTSANANPIVQVTSPTSPDSLKIGDTLTFTYKPLNSVNLSNSTYPITFFGILPSHVLGDIIVKFNDVIAETSCFTIYNQVNLSVSNSNCWSSNVAPTERKLNITYHTVPEISVYTVELPAATIGDQVEIVKYKNSQNLGMQILQFDGHAINLLGVGVNEPTINDLGLTYEVLYVEEGQRTILLSKDAQNGVVVYKNKEVLDPLEYELSNIGHPSKVILKGALKYGDEIKIEIK